MQKTTNLGGVYSIEPGRQYGKANIQNKYHVEIESLFDCKTRYDFRQEPKRDVFLLSRHVKDFGNQKAERIRGLDTSLAPLCRKVKTFLFIWGESLPTSPFSERY